jgi:hypothetical protein
VFKIGLFRLCPFKYTQDYQDADRGDHIALTATHDGVNMRAVAWRDGKVNFFVGICGTTVPGVPHDNNRWRNNKRHH